MYVPTLYHLSHVVRQLRKCVNLYLSAMFLLLRMLRGFLHTLSSTSTEEDTHTYLQTYSKCATLLIYTIGNPHLISPICLFAIQGMLVNRISDILCIFMQLLLWKTHSLFGYPLYCRVFVCRTKFFWAKWMITELGCGFSFLYFCCCYWCILNLL